MNITGIILSGGKSLRMGMDKGFLEIDGKPMIQYVIDHINPVCDQVLISANLEAYSGFGYQVVPDVIKDIGPAGGIISCLPHTDHKKCLIISCDLPYVSTAFIESLVPLSDGYEITIPQVGPIMQPLCGIYSNEIYHRLKKLVDQGQYSMQKLVRLFTLNIVDQSDLRIYNFHEELRNINRRSDLASSSR
jgi:molybdopterin-guanine dinucleotide biosynthesis protein A